MEVELQVLDAKTFELSPGAPAILGNHRDDPHIKEELLESIVEINTDICPDVAAVREDLRKRFRAVIQTAEDLDFRLISMGTHPFSRWKDQSVTKLSRYQEFVQRIQWPLRRLLITGIHIHVGVESGEKAVAITNGLNRYIPHLIGLSANSPLHDGQVTGLASTRTKLFEGMPTTGLPHQLRNYSEFQKFVRTLQKANAIESIREVWWDIRPHPRFGTVEIRVFDSVPTLGEMVNLTALTQCLVTGISQHYDEGAQLDLLPPWVVSENKWRATRHGLEADIIVDDTGTLQSLRQNILETIDKLWNIADDLGCSAEIEEITQLAEHGQAPYQRQLAVYQQTKNPVAVLKDAVAALKGSVYD